jgi:hypothetical protein
MSDLGKAMRTLKDSISARGLLDVATILHAESEGELRIWYPGTSELITG